MSHHTQILRIARAGNPTRALRLFREQGLDQHKDDPKLLTLHGRLLKDRARQCSGDDRVTLFRGASAAYLAAFACEPDTYPLINAAALELLAGNQAASRKHAQRVLDMMEADLNEGETPYWREATRAEALLLLDQPAVAKTALAAAIEKQPLAHEDLAATVDQFEAIIAAQNGDPTWLEAHRPPSSLHFSGLIVLDQNGPGLREAIEEKIAELHPGYAFGALAAGADIMIAEAATSAGVQLHVVLPSSAKAFRANSVEPYGADWCSRFDALIEQAAHIETLPSHADPEDYPSELSIELANLVAMGRCLRHADNLRSNAHALTIYAQGEEDRPHIARWLQSDRSLERIETSRQNDGLSGDGSKSNLQLAGLVLITSSDQAKVDLTARKHNAISVAVETESLFTATAKNSLAFVLECLEAAPNCRASILIDGMDMARPDNALIDRIRLISRGWEFGRIAVDRQTALIAKVLDRSLELEETGELASLYGPISLWSGEF